MPTHGKATTDSTAPTASPVADHVVATESSSDEEIMPPCKVTTVEPTAHSVVQILSERAAERASKTVERRNRRSELLSCCTRPAAD